MPFRFALAAIALAAAGHGTAQTLGAAQGVVLIGRPLDIVVQTQAGAGGDSDSLCVQADVRYGETPIGASDVSVSVERMPSGEVSGLRVRTRPVVNEPFVTVEVRIGCSARFVRSYTLLADVEPMRAPPPPPVVSAAPAAAAAGTLARASGADQPVRRAAPAPETPIRSLAPSPRPPGVARLASKTRPVAAPAASAAERGSVQIATEPAPRPAGPRLELEPVDIGQGAANGATDAPAQPAGPVAPSPAEAGGGEPQQAAAVEQELARLRAEQQRLLAAVESLNRELTATREGRQDGLVYALAGLVAVLLGALLWLMRRRVATSAGATVKPWWAVSGDKAADILSPEARGAASHAGTPAEMPSPGGHAAATTPSATAAGDHHLAGLEVSEAGASVFQEVPIAPLNVAALHELWEQVDFFESLGQVGEAIAALRHWVEDHPRASEAPYLRWMALARQYGWDSRQAELTYEHHFQRLLARDDGPTGVAGLEADRAFVSAITTEWPREPARARIEAALASQPGEPSSVLQVRTLAAFDDLLLLHRVLDGLAALPPADTAAGAPTAAAVAQADHDVGAPLDFELPDVSSLSRSVTADRSAAPRAAAEPDAHGRDGGLDFHLSGWTPPPPAGPKATP